MTVPVMLTFSAFDFEKKMPKRALPDDEISTQALKKQISVRNSTIRAREIRSSSSERTLQLLYKGAALSNGSTGVRNGTSSKGSCMKCATDVPLKNDCSYCEKCLCLNCISFCYKCKKGFCSNCSFLTYDDDETACYECY